MPRAGAVVDPLAANAFSTDDFRTLLCRARATVGDLESPGLRPLGTELLAITHTGFHFFLFSTARYIYCVYSLLSTRRGFSFEREIEPLFNKTKLLNLLNATHCFIICCRRFKKKNCRRCRTLAQSVLYNEKSSDVSPIPDALFE